MANIFICGLLGLCLGSFFNVITSRKDWYKGRSKCDECGHALRWHELIPILSFIVQRGKCRHCGAKIDKSHIVAELFSLCGGIVLAISGIEFVSAITMTVLLFNAIMDYKTRMVQSLVTYAGCFAVILYKFCTDVDTGAIFTYCLFVFITIITLYVLAKIFSKYIGEGDFEIMYLLILSLGHIGFLYCLFYASIIGMAYALLKKLNRKTQIPFVPLLYFGYMAALLI